jgi:hypothetical protein
LALGEIDLGLALEHHLAAVQIPVQVGLAGTIDGLLRKSAHSKQLLAQFIKPLLKSRTHYPNLPVM